MAVPFQSLHSPEVPSDCARHAFTREAVFKRSFTCVVGLFQDRGSYRFWTHGDDGACHSRL